MVVYGGGQEGCPPRLVLDRKKGERSVYVGMLMKVTMWAGFQMSRIGVEARCRWLV
jgi:hypothetical protein